MTGRAGPVRILHLIDQPGTALGGERPTEPDAALILCASLVRRLPEFEQSVCLVGGNALEERCAGAGLPPGLPSGGRIAPSLGLAARGQAGLRAFLRDRGTPDVVHCWSVAALSLASAASRAMLCATLTGPVAPPALGAGRLRSGRVRLTLFGDADGWRGALGTPTGAALMCPVPRVAMAMGRSREDVRRSLRVGGAEPVVLLIGGAPGEADAMRLVSLLGLLDVAERPAVWVVPGSAARLARALRLRARLGRRSRLIVTDRPFAEQAAGADLAVWLGGAWSDTAGAGPTPAGAVLIGAALAAGVPVVAPRASLIEPLYPGATGAQCLAFNAAVTEAARLLLPLVGDAERRAALRLAVAEEPAATLGPPFERRVAEQWLACGQVGAGAIART